MREETWEEAAFEAAYEAASPPRRRPAPGGRASALRRRAAIPAAGRRAGAWNGARTNGRELSVRCMVRWRRAAASAIVSGRVR
mmetsp:Transcript_4060/g.10715  ORF Transcript_4060/g.10715 Transcript_4060/m.10715 type:complete len:83 (-) Transcript_4060:29-277(-)